MGWSAREAFDRMLNLIKSLDADSDVEISFEVFDAVCLLCIYMPVIDRPVYTCRRFIDLSLIAGVCGLVGEFGRLLLACGTGCTFYTIK